MARWVVFATLAVISCLPMVICSLGADNEAISDELAFQYSLFPYPPRPVVNLADIKANIKHCEENTDSCTPERQAQLQKDLDNFDANHEAVLKRDESLATVLDWLPGIVHHGFGGTLDVSKSDLRVLIAGGGTGDATLYLARQLSIISPKSVLVHLDLSLPAVEIAKYRAHNMNLTNIKFVHGSIFDITAENVGTFHYINCAGVLNLFPEPKAALQILTKVLHPDGIIGLMLYGELGRTGLYDVQQMMKLLRTAPTVEEAAAEADDTEELLEVEIGTLTSKGVQYDKMASSRLQKRKQAHSQLPAEEQRKKKQEQMGQEIALLRELFVALPATNRVKRDMKFYNQIIGEVATEGGAYDMFLTAQDTPYKVPDVYDLVESAGLSVITFHPAAQYDPLAILGLASHPELRRKVAALSPKQRAIFAELLSGAMHQHSLYVTHKSNVEKGSDLHPATAPHKGLTPLQIPCFSPFFSPARYNAQIIQFNNTSEGSVNVTGDFMLINFQANQWFVGSPNHTLSYVVSNLVVDESIYGDCKMTLGDIYVRYVTNVAKKEGRDAPERATLEQHLKLTSDRDAEGNPTWHWFATQIQPIYAMWSETNDVALTYAPFLW